MAEAAAAGLGQAALRPLARKAQNEIVRLYENHYNIKQIKETLFAVLDQIHDDTKALRQANFKTARDLTTSWQNQSIKHIASPTSIQDLWLIRFHAGLAINLVTDPIDKLVAVGMLIHATFHYTVLTSDAITSGSGHAAVLDATFQAKERVQTLFKQYVQDCAELKSAAEEEMSKGFLRFGKRRAFGDKEKRRKLLLQFARLGHSVFLLPPCYPLSNHQHPRFRELEKAVEKVARNHHGLLSAPALPIIDGPYCYRTLSGLYSGQVYCCVVFDNGRQLASGNEDKTIKLWDLGTGRCKRNLKGHTDGISCCAVFDDGRHLVGGSADNSLTVWDLDTGECKRTLTGHTSHVMCCAVFDDGRQLVSGSSDKTIRLWDIVGTDSGCTGTLRGHSDRVMCCTVFDKGQKLASGSWDMTIKLWDLVGRPAGKECVHTLEGHTRDVLCLVVFDEGRQLASGSSDNTIKVWDLVGGTTAGPECTRTLRGHDNTVNCCAVFDEGRQLVSGSYDETIKLWDLGTGHCMHTLKGHSDWVRCCSVFDDGRQLASGSNDCTIKLWDLSNRSS